MLIGQQQVDAVLHGDRSGANRTQGDAAWPLPFLPGALFLWHETRGRSPFSRHGNTDDYSLFYCQLRKANMFAFGHNEEQQDGMKQIEPLLGQSRYGAMVEPSMNFEA